MLNSFVYKNDLQKTIQHSLNIDELAGKCVLITGGTGTIGSWLIDTIIEYNMGHYKPIRVLAVGRDINKLKDQFYIHKSKKWICFERYNLSEEISFDYNIDYVIHAAGNAHPQAFNSDPVGTIVGNVWGTYKLLQYAKSHGAKRFLYISSGEVYGKGDVALDTFMEDYGGYIDSIKSRSSYPNSKRVTETLCASYYVQYGLETIIVRPSHTYGPTITDNDNRANAEFIMKAISGQNIVMKSGGTQLRSYTYIADCVSAILTVLLKGKPGEAYNSANENSRCTISEFAEKVANIAGIKVYYEEASNEEKKYFSPIPKQVLDNTKLKELGWEAAFSLETGIDHIYRILKLKDVS